MNGRPGVLALAVLSALVLAGAACGGGGTHASAAGSASSAGTASSGPAAGANATSRPGSAAGRPAATPGAPAATPLARSDAAVVYDGAHDQVLLFGGTGGDGRPLGDTWTWDGQRWLRKQPAASPPAGRSGWMAFDGASGKVVLFGGAGTWTWDGETWAREHPAHEPPRAGLLAYDPSLGVVILYAPSPVAGTAWTWGWNGGDWYPVNDAPPGPQAVEALAYDVRGGRLIGLGSGTWAFIGYRWTRLGDQPEGLPAAGVAEAASLSLNAPVAFGGGANDGVGLSNALWSWEGKQWKRQDVASAPPARRGAALVDDEKRGQLVLFGGAGASGALGDTWLWTPDKGWVAAAA